VVDGEPYIRHLYFSENWMIHRKSSKIYQDLYPKEQAEAIQLLENFHHRLKPQILTQISCIYHELKLDYFGVDCDILADGRLLIFEANATMTTLLNYDKSPNHFDKPISILKNAIEAMILNRINSTNLEKQNND